MCGLILANRHHARLRQQNVGRLQDRVGEEAVVDVVGLLRLLLFIGRSALDPAHGRDGHQDPGELLHLGAMALHKEGALVRVEAKGNERRGHLARLAPQLLAVVHAGKGVVINDAVDGLVVLLQRHVIADGAQVVPQVRRPARLDPRIGADRLLRCGRLRHACRIPRWGIRQYMNEVPAMRRSARQVLASVATLALLVLAGAAPATVRANGFPQQADTWVATSGRPTGSNAGTSCSAPGFVVDGVQDEIEIGYAIADVLPGGTVHLCAGTYHVTEGQGYDKSFTLAGAGRDATVIVGTAIFNTADEYVSGGSEFLWQLGTFTDNLTLSLRDLTIRGFCDDGSGYGTFYGADYVLDRVRMDHNGSLSGASGAFVAGNVTARNSIFSKNLSSSGGGAIDAGRVVVSYSTFSDNVSAGRGGAIVASSGSLARVDFFRNRAAFEGGAVAVSGSGTFTVTHSRFWKNHAEQVGGALWSSASNVTVKLSRFTSNVSDVHGGAIYAYQGSLNVVSSRFGHNRAVESAGAIASTLQNSFAVSRSTFYKNRAGAFGGAITVNGTVGKQKVERSIFLRNSATDGGGAIYMDGGDSETGGVLADLSGVRFNSFLRNSGADGGAITVASCDVVPATSQALIRRANTYVRNTSPIGEPAVFFARYGC